MSFTTIKRWCLPQRLVHAWKGTGPIFRGCFRETDWLASVPAGTPLWPMTKGFSPFIKDVTPWVESTQITRGKARGVDLLNDTSLKQQLTSSGHSWLSAKQRCGHTAAQFVVPVSQDNMVWAKELAREIGHHCIRPPLFIIIGLWIPITYQYF